MAAVTDIDNGLDIRRLLRILQLVSPTLPVGGFAYSQGMEWAVESGWITNAQETYDWICGVLRNSLARLDVPVLVRLYNARQHSDMEIFEYWNRYLLAARGSAELQQEELQMGLSLYRLLLNLMPDSMTPCPCHDPSFTAMFAVAAANWRIDIETTCTGLLWAWAENRVAAAVKLVPLGQTEGQRILMQIAEQIPDIVKTGMVLKTEEIGAATPALSIVSAKHETQYTRLFRS